MHNKQNNKETKSYVQGLRRFSNTLPRGVKGILKKNGYNYSEIIGKWNILAGKDISGYCYPKSIKMKNEKSNGTLILAVERGNEINVEYSKKIIIDRINSYFGYKLISDIKLETFNSNKKSEIQKKQKLKSPKNLEKKIENITNSNIRNSLLQLLKTINND
tara:strand:- start:1413 stop:1895 length:483 start_codon:yes stop_codon:yes gene_type:complete